jgi:glutathione S-transferase
MNKLLYAPGACSIGIHVLLEEIGKPYQAEQTDLRAPPPERSLTRMNPKSKVPTLVRDDGSVLTEFPAIAWWLARTNPQAHLVPDDAEGQARVLEALDYVVSTVHMRSFTLMNRPANFSPEETAHDSIRARGRENFSKGLAILNQALEGKEYIAGEKFSIADAALFYVELWAARANVPLPPNCAAHFARMKARPAVAAVLKKEDIAA